MVTDGDGNARHTNWYETNHAAALKTSGDGGAAAVVLACIDPALALREEFFKGSLKLALLIKP